MVGLFVPRRETTTPKAKRRCIGFLAGLGWLRRSRQPGQALLASGPLGLGNLPADTKHAVVKSSDDLLSPVLGVDTSAIGANPRWGIPFAFGGGL